MRGHQGESVTENEIVQDIESNIGVFKLDESLRLGDADSAHQVMFGALDPHGIVAIKPFTKEGKALTELSAMNRIRDRGFETLDPILVATGSLATYLVTHRRQGLNHLGQVTWDVEDGSAQLNKVIVPKLHMAADVAGSLHGAGIEHGDFQAKNVVFDRSGAPVIVDLERAAIGRGRQDLISGSEKDMTKFSLSVLSKGLLHDRSPHYRARFLGEEFIAPSLERANAKINLADSDASRKALEVKIESSLIAKAQSRRSPHRREPAQKAA